MKLTSISLLANGASAANLLAAHFTGSIFSLSYENGVLTQTGEVSGDVAMPSWLTVADGPDGKKVYVADESSGEGVAVTYDVDANGQLSNTVITPVPGGSVHSAVYGDGFFAAARYNNGSIFTQKLPLTPTSGILQTFTYTMSSPGPKPDRQEGPHPHWTFVDPTGRFLLSADLGADLIRIYRINATSGALTECPAAETGPGDGPRHGAFWSASKPCKPPSTTNESAQGLYVANELGNSLTFWKMEYGDECLALNSTQTLSTYPAGMTPKTGSKAAEVHIRDNFVYVSNRNDETFGAKNDSIATYTIDAATGELSFVELTSAFGYFPRTFEIHPDGNLVAIGGQTSSNVAIVERNETTGRLGDLLATIDIATPGTVNNEDGMGAVVWV
ncbi:hypothetical protein TD95_002797 [Thielaviopsis punctulata]|uniref:6-phosphogluconolactonase n=1 Tax=Thielaviopsis punctulata TaxID=72032 RepID=A0A0F4ZI10_9PEZI|nr:hypothetical protein TD95_002797 [Thielaviopsis punctulata]